MATRLPLIQLLGAHCLARDDDLPAMDANLVDWLIRTGCAPLAWRTWRERLHRVPGAHKLQGAELTARVMHGALRGRVTEVLAALNDAGIDVVPLKGLSAACRYYAEPHLRMMGDVDLLLERRAIPDAVSLCERMGFASRADLRPAGYADHHHVAPLYHGEWQLWIELHHGLLKPDFVAAGDPPFDDPWSTAREGELNGQRVRWLSRECELAYVAASLCLDIIIGFPNERLQRNLVDAALILNAADRRVDTERLLAWSADSSTGACLLVLLHYLDRHELFDGDALLPALRDCQRFVDARTCRVFTYFLDRYVARPQYLGWAARRTLPGVARQLLGRRTAARNRLFAALRLPG